jgi:tRNA threonylcarbamoyladenosine biosynthesis protein TsaE
VCFTHPTDLNHFTFTADDETGTARLGAALAQALPAGTVVALYGTLGAGKTRLVQAMAEALGIDRRQVVSPTFMLIQEYHGQKSIYHADAYRLRDEDEFLALGPDEYFDGDGLVLVEWADRVAGCLPRERVDVRIEVTGENQRQFHITATDEKYSMVIADLAGKLDQSPHP